MLFNSIEFLLFLTTVFFLYWFVFKNQLRAQNVLLLVASYIFYGWWDWRFLSLIIASTFLDYFIAIRLGKTDIAKKRKFLLGIRITFTKNYPNQSYIKHPVSLEQYLMEGSYNKVNIESHQFVLSNSRH